MKKVSLGLTVLVALIFVGSGLSSLMGAKPVMEAYVRLKIPTHIGMLLGIAKLCASVALLLTLWKPSLRRLREWAFAGLTFNMLGATWWHLAGGDSVQQTVPPIVLLVLVLATWFVGVKAQEADVAS